MINNNKSFAILFALIVTAFSSTGLVQILNIATAQPLQHFEFSDLNCFGMFNCNSDQSNDTTINTTQSCESGNDIESSPGVLTNTCNLNSSGGDSTISTSPPIDLS